MSSDVTNIDDLLASFDELWAPRIVARVNDWAVKIAKVRGEHVWHAHADTDEVFVVLAGELEIARRDPGGELPRQAGRGVPHVVPDDDPPLPLREQDDLGEGRTEDPRDAAVQLLGDEAAHVIRLDDVGEVDRAHSCQD